MRPNGPPDQLEARRREAIAMLKSGKPYRFVAQKLKASLSSVVRWYQTYRKKGCAGIQSQAKWGRPSLLTDRQKEKLKKKLLQGATAVGHTTDLWTLQRIVRLIQADFGVRYTHVGVWKLLRNDFGWSCQKPGRQAFQRDEKAITDWKNKTLPYIKKRFSAHTECSYIVFIDETGFMLGPLVRRTWAPRGKTPVIRQTTPHERISCIGAMAIRRVSVRFGFHFHLLPDNLNFQGRSVAAFLAHLHHKLRGAITVIWDEVRIHSADPVKEFLSKHPNMVVEQLPPYAPELNPVDYVWSFVKYARLANFCPHNLFELRKAVTTELTTVKNSPRLLRSLFSGTGLTLDGLG